MKLNGNGNGKGKVYTESKFKQGMQTCHICGRTNDWACRITEDEGLAYCSFTPNDSGKTDKIGRYEYILKTNAKSNSISAKQTTDKNIATTKVDADRLNEVYSAFLDGLILNPNHSDDLLNRRRLSDTDISRNLYASVPAKNKITEIVHEFAKSHNLEGVPGFYFSGRIWRLNIDCAGYFIPYRDEKGRIVGLQVRKDNAVDKKYLWVSSSDKDKGVSSGTPPHFVNAELPNGRNEIFLTEGALKADIIGGLLGVKVVATAGVAVIVPEILLDTVFRVFPNLGKIVVAYDMDWQTNENVRSGLVHLLDALDGKDVAVDVATWDISLGKGLDDVLVNKNYEQSDVKYIPVAEFREMLAVETSDNVEETVVEQSESTPVIEDFVVEYNEPINDESIGTDTGFEGHILPDKDIDTFGITCRDFLAMDLPILERVIWGLGRGNLGLMVASTNIGKTTIALNLSLSAGMDKTFSPLFDENHKAQKVMYIDGEATKSELQADIRKMLESCSIEEQESIKDNLCFVCDEEINDEPLDLVNPKHLQIVIEKAKQFKPDLIIVDTLSALTLMEDENDNAKVNKEVIQPLKALGRKANAGVLILHHTGKYSEGSPQAEAANQGRGASALPALSRVVYNLKKVSGSESQVTLSCSKDKVGKFESVVMELDQNTRWFGIVDGVSAKVLTKSEQDYWKVVNYVKNENRQVERKEIVEKFTANKELSTSTVGRILEKAIKNGDLAKDYGSYFSPELKGNSESEKDNTQYCRVSRKDATKIYVNPNQELAVKK